MAIDPNPQIYSATSTGEITAINFGTGDAGTYEDLEAGTEYRIWNDKGRVLDSSTMTSVKVTVRDADGLEVNNITTQHWVEIKSTTIVAGAAGAGSSGDLTGMTNDDMPEFKAIGEDNYATLGNIPANCYRIILVRINIPTSAIQAGVTFSLYVTNQQPSTSITKWITGLLGNGVVPTGNMLAVTDSSGADSKIKIASGYALIDSAEIYYGASQTYTLSTGAGTYKTYLTSAGVISSTIASMPDNSICLALVTIAGGVVSSVTDKRIYLEGFRAGTINAIPEAPFTPGSMFFDKTNGILYGAQNSSRWKIIGGTKTLETVSGTVTFAGSLTATKL